MTPIETHGFVLVDWQEEAVDAWARGDREPFTGTLEIFTGGGKTLLALAAAERVSAREPDLRLAVVVPTEALARQWITSIERYTNLDRRDIGLLGAGGKDSLRDKRALVAVLNSAAKVLPAMAVDAQPLMLVVDECHRAGAPSFSRVLDTPSAYRLGLSATPDREEIGDDGEPLEFDEQKVGKALGSVVAHFSLKDARRVGWLPDYQIYHHGLTLHAKERQDYEAISRRVDDLGDRLRQLGVDTTRAQMLRGQQGDVGDAARAYVSATSSRKDLLYRARERTRVAAKIVTKALGAREHRVLLFHERVDQATQLHSALSEALPDQRVVLEHSRLPDAERAAAMRAFRSGAASVLVSVKSLIEGIDVPEADVGVSVASSSSVRQRIQALGRVLRRTFDEADAPKHAEMHLLYVADTVDELIYTKEDWSDLTGEGENVYWRWGLDPDQPEEPQDGPPASPRPTEEQEWERLGERPPAEPVRWLGVLSGQEYSVDTLGTVRNAWDVSMTNAQGVDDMVTAVRSRPGGRFRVTPKHRLVLVMREGTEGTEVLVAGQLPQPFEAVEDATADEVADLDVDALEPGDEYHGPANHEGGEYKLRMKLGGVIERRRNRGSEFALTEGSGHAELEQNATRLLDAWRHELNRGLTIYVNDLGHAWYEAGGKRCFLASVPGGFAWPDNEGAPAANGNDLPRSDPVERQQGREVLDP